MAEHERSEYCSLIFGVTDLVRIFGVADPWCVPADRYCCKLSCHLKIVKIAQCADELMQVLCSTPCKQTRSAYERLLAEPLIEIFLSSSAHYKLCSNK